MEAISPVIPITLRGDNLGERHRYYNSLVQDAYQKSVLLENILQLPEWSPIDVLFKIDLASKYRNVDFIVKVLKGENMLYVRRVLNCTWLLHADFQNIINPVHLESQLYPNMITQSVNEMKHWIQNNLKDSARCQQFYEFYDDFNTKIKFLYHCTPEFVMDEFLKIINKVTPKQLKILCEYCPKVVKLYYDNLTSNPDALDRFLQDELNYIDCCKFILKAEPDIFFDVTEEYYVYKPYSPAITDYIMSTHRERFSAKPELYAAQLLHKETVAKYLNSDEAKDLVLRLARAEYLRTWFSFQNVETFVKRIKKDERAAFKKQVFEDKDIGESVKDWPYPIPCRPEIQNSDTIFDDIPHRQLFIHERGRFKRHIKKRQYCCKMESLACPMMSMRIVQRRRTLLDELFDKYRFNGFEETFPELQKRLKAESSVKNREFIMLVLVSKCGENLEQIEKLMRLLAKQYVNESTNLRATVLRSLVVRACVWRLPSSAWSALQDFARGLGVDGVPPIICCEGMHAAMLRVLLSGENCPESLRTAFLEDFSNFTTYKLSTVEKRVVRERLPAFLLTSALTEPDCAIDRLQLLLNTLSDLKMQVEDCPGALEAMVAAVRRDPSSGRHLLIDMYNKRIARRELINENFNEFNTDESYLNVLRHNSDLLKSTNNFEETLKSHSFNYDGFLRKLSLYFGEQDGLASLYAEVIKSIAESQPHVSLARPLALVHDNLAPMIEECMKELKDNPKKQLGNALRSNYYLKKLADVDAADWNTSSAKAIINRVMLCKAVDVEKYLAKSLQHRCTLKLALHLAERGGDLPRVYDIVKTKRPAVAIRSAISYFRRNKGNKVETDVWRKVAPALDSLDMSLPRNYQLQRTLQKGKFVPANIEAEYWIDVYKLLQKGTKEKIIPVISKFENLLPEIDSHVIKEVIERFLEGFTLNAIKDTYYSEYYELQMRIIAKYLLLSTSESQQQERLDSVWAPFLDRLAQILLLDFENAIPCLECFVIGLKYNRAFFDSSLAPLMPAFKRIVTDLQRTLPMERYFRVFVKFHAIMLYCKAIEQVLKTRPAVFKDVKTKQTDGAREVGHVYGKLVGLEVKELVASYFKTVINIYNKHIANFLLQEFNGYVEGTFVKAFIKGLIDTGNTEALRLAEFLLKNYYVSHEDPEIDELFKRLKESGNEELKFFLCADF